MARVVASASIIMFSLVACIVVRAADQGSMLSRVRAAGVLRCGMDIEQAEYSTSDDHGNRAAFDADLCRAVSLAVLGENSKFEVKEYPDDAAAMAALASGDIDMVATLPDDFSHSTGTHLSFTRPVLWDGVGFLLPATSPAKRARELGGKRVCFLAETAVEETARAWFAREHLDFAPFPFQEEGEMQAAFSTGNCAALAGERTHLAQTRAALAQHGKPTRLLPESISKDPLAAAVRDNDPQWLSIVNWVMEVLMEAEENSITLANVRGLRAHAAQEKDPLRRFLLGGSKQIGSGLGLDDKWVGRVIEATGNYGEIYERDLGSASPLKLTRGDNRLYRNGGAMLALPPR